jgi:hypothetical protein
MKPHRPWQPRLPNDPLFNPFAPTTERGSPISRIEIDETEEVSEEVRAGAQPSAAGDAPAAKPVHDASSGS